MTNTVLLVDDSRTILLSISDILSTTGLQVATAGTGEEALDKLKAGLRPNLFITDVNMPGMNGLELIREIRTLAHLRFAKILLLTTESHQDKRIEAKSLGATGWLVKPVKSDDLLRVIRQVLPGAF